MVFWRGQRNKDQNEITAPEQTEIPTSSTNRAPEPLSIERLKRVVDPNTLGFKTTDDLTPITGLIGQDRALAAIEFGTEMRAHDYNIFVLGPPASGKHTALKTQLQKKALTSSTPNDWVYVYNFDEPNQPRALRLPTGRARKFAKSMIAAIDELRAVVPSVIESEDYQSRRRAVDSVYEAHHEKALETLTQKAAVNNIAILRTPQGFAMAPMHEGKIVKPETFNALPDSMRAEKQAQIVAFETELAEILRRLPKSEKERRAKVVALNEDVSRAAVTGALDDVIAAFRDVPSIVTHLQAAAVDLVRNIAIFIPTHEQDSGPIREPADTTRDVRYRRYLVNVVVANNSGPDAESNDNGTGAPLIDELNPNYGNLIGRIEHVAQMGTIMTDFLLIKPGALHRANGGYLLLDARKLLTSPFAYDALKRALKSREIRIEQPAEAAGLLAPQSLDPEPIPLNVKVILTGERETFYQLHQLDPDFGGLFKVQADFDDTIQQTTDNQRAFAQILASVVVEHKLRPLTASAVARVIEHGARLADDQDKISIALGIISDVVRESDYWASKNNHSTIEASDVSHAIDTQIQRADRIRDHAQETVERGLILIDTDGGKIGQINGLAVLQIGNFSFGRPNRITARVRMGSGRIVDIEREAKLGGSLHTKGVMILYGFLAGRYAQDFPLALGATLTFEQSYGGVDGDSASSAELYALLSAIAEAPIRQGLAVTGSVNQWGEVQAIGGVNEKIEGFFDICKERGLTGGQGVLIPKSNAQHLMLRDDVISAARSGKFHIYPIAHVDEGIELLTGIVAGTRTSDRTYPTDSLNARIELRLRNLADKAHQFSTPPKS
ncbi:MAG: AAA family ATPase [Hyphomicrobiaceae bacterium]|nr:AAA family ATPase [Hyphomicrobiaceae bacterium]